MELIFLLLLAISFSIRRFSLRFVAHFSGYNWAFSRSLLSAHAQRLDVSFLCMFEILSSCYSVSSQQVKIIVSQQLCACAIHSYLICCVLVSAGVQLFHQLHRVLFLTSFWIFLHSFTFQILWISNPHFHDFGE